MLLGALRYSCYSKQNRFSDSENFLRKLILYILCIIYIVLKYLTLTFRGKAGEFDFAFLLL